MSGKRIFEYFVFLFLCLLDAPSPLTADETCKSCHLQKHDAWEMSHHSGAMQIASADSVLGDFSGVTVVHSSQTAAFFYDERFKVSLSDEGHPPQTYTIAYTFGVTPLQQYLVETTSGQFQVLPFAWDSRDKADGGQRWFHIYPDEQLPPGDRLHWQQPLQNWNGMCADCHSTGLKRNYDSVKMRFDTSFDSVNVSCSSCHAGSADHAKARLSGKKDPESWKSDLLNYLDNTGGFVREEGQATAKWSGDKPRQRPELNTCAACHSRRAPLTDGINPSEKFLNQFSPSLLNDGLYFPDGQIQDEVYVWGSFQQSKMFAAGVSCLDCHDSHSLKLKAEGNAVCTQCHSSDVFEQETHHKHATDNDGSKCVSCHMPERTYMVVDPRRDHSFKIPNPALSSSTGSPNACVTCHSDKSNSWAASTLKEWYPNTNYSAGHIRSIAHARRGYPSSRAGLRSLITDESQPAITRATALSLVPRVATPELIQTAMKELSNEEPLMRIGAVRAMAILPPHERLAALSSLLDDDIKAVRIEAARQLLDVPEAQVHKKAFVELLQVDELSSWRGEGRMNIATAHELAGDILAAEETYRKSLEIDPSFAPAIINLSELLRRSGREAESFQIIEKASQVEGFVDPAIIHAYGLALIRSGQSDKALTILKKAMIAQKENARYTYVYLVALNSLGQADKAYKGLRTALRRHRYDRELLSFALSIALNKRDAQYANQLVSRLLELEPNNRDLQRLKGQLKK